MKFCLAKNCLTQTIQTKKDHKDKICIDKQRLNFLIAMPIKLKPEHAFYVTVMIGYMFQ